jgi:hypothetical protein
MSTAVRSGNIDGVTLLERMEEILRDCFGGNARSWARAAGLSELTHVSTALRRLRENPEHQPAIDTLDALARGAGISFEWLATGRGSRVPVAVRPESRYPSRSSALAAGRLIGLPDSALEAVARVDDLASDPGAEYWIQRLLLAAREPAPTAKRDE